jgi:hypothetical protein
MSIIFCVPPCLRVSRAVELGAVLFGVPLASEAIGPMAASHGHVRRCTFGTPGLHQLWLSETPAVHSAALLCNHSLSPLGARKIFVMLRMIYQAPCRQHAAILPLFGGLVSLTTG